MLSETLGWEIFGDLGETEPGEGNVMKFPFKAAIFSVQLASVVWRSVVFLEDL